MDKPEQEQTIYLYYSQATVDEGKKPYFLGSVPAGECAKDTIYHPPFVEDDDISRDHIRYTHSSFSKTEYPHMTPIWQGPESKFRPEGVFGVWNDDYQQNLPTLPPTAPAMSNRVSFASGSESQLPVSCRHVLSDSDSLDIMDVFCAAARAKNGDVVVIPPAKADLKMFAETQKKRYGVEGVSFELGDV